MPIDAVNAKSAAAASFEPSAGARAAVMGSFSGALAEASKKRTSSAYTPDSVLDAKKAPKNEKTKPVEGHAYADIVSGPRNGMYVNTSGNKRDGQAFVLLKRDGKEYHIYGSGKDRVVVCLRRKHDDDTPKVKNETTKPAADTKPSGTTGSAASVALARDERR